MTPLKVCIAQLDFTVGAIAANVERMSETILAHRDHDLVVFPELALTGYPPEDLLYREDFASAVEAGLAQLANLQTAAAVVVGHPHRVGDECFNAVSILQAGKVIARYFKQRLPNYGVFDEQRYFIPGHESCVFELKGQRIGLLICEDLWHQQPLQRLQQLGVDWVLSINASPFEMDKYEQRLHVLKQRVSEANVGIVYVNNCGGQDELVFDGQSLVLDKQGQLVARLPIAQPCTMSLALGEDWQALSDEAMAPLPDEIERVYLILVLAIRDYVQKNGFGGVVLGLSGGIDSALTLALAVAALGAEKVQAVMMPYHYTSSMSLEDAERQAQRLGVQYDVVPIAPMVETFQQQLAPLFADLPVTGGDTTVENLQARSRGVLLMALSNKTGKLVLTTGNKSEMAVGYATLYGDMCGGFAPLKDLPKMLVFALARFCNRAGEVIPQRVIDRPPSAELAPDQTDEASLMPYEDLDRVLQLYIEQDWSVSEICALGYDQQEVQRILTLVDVNEYKRRQSAVGPKVTHRNFGKDRRQPITNHFRYQAVRKPNQ